MKVLIIEDETAAVNNLRSLLHTVESQAEVVGVTDSITGSVQWFEDNDSPDLIFMDIHLADGDAFSIFDKTRVSAPVIFTTAYDSYALEAFRVNSIDYLLKPLQSEDLKRALEKLKNLTRLELEAYLNRTQQSMAATKPVKTFLIPVKDKIMPLSVSEIAFCHTTGEKVFAFTYDNRRYPLDRSLDILGNILPDEDFFRANRQFIISRRAITDMAVWYGSRLSVNLKVNVPERIIVSKNRVPVFKSWIAAT
jgi:two-component system, LytTR family, response regulator LytT